jgi:hypothetical protein
MGLYTGGKLYPWGNPVALLTFPGLSVISRLRYALFAFVSVRRERWDSIEQERAETWIVRWCGREVYDKLWDPLFKLKFFEYADNISAPWIWTRIKRIGRSRRSMMQEQLGYLEGGSETLGEGALPEHSVTRRRNPPELSRVEGRRRARPRDWRRDAARLSRGRRRHLDHPDAVRFAPGSGPAGDAEEQLRHDP